MGTKTYAEIEKDLPTIVKAELSKQDDLKRQLFAEEFGRKRKTLFHSYGFLLLCSAHRWYLGQPWMTVLTWVLILCGGIGLIWVLVDLFLIPSMRRERNAEIAKSILAEYRIISGDSSSQYAQPHAPQTPIINISNNN
jgi:TM2 domain-containing membrane protein YozV